MSTLRFAAEDTFAQIEANVEETRAIARWMHRRQKTVPNPYVVTGVWFGILAVALVVAVKLG